MRAVLSISGAFVALLLLLAGCGGVPSGPLATPSASTVTVAPAATEAPSLTQAAPASATTARVATPTAEPAPSVEAAPTLTPAGAAVDLATPAPTMPPQPTGVPVAIDCAPGALTPAQTEGPYYKANPPETNSLLQPGMSGTPILLTGYVLDERCQPIRRARVDFWQADAQGQYDNGGYTLRGYTLTDAEGRYAMKTVVPGEYPGRTPHIHVKITPPGGQTLTSQLYLPDAAANATDRIFSPELVADVEQGTDGLVGTFNFVVRSD